MADLNHWTGIGRLTREAEIKYTADGTAVVNFAIAVNRRKGKDGTETTDFFDVTLWGKQGEGLKQYLVKGKQIAIEGRLQQDRWTDQQGQPRSKISIVAENVQLLGGTRVDLPQGAPINQGGQYGNQYGGGNQYGNQYGSTDQGGAFPERIPF